MLYPFTYEIEYCDEVNYTINVKFGLLYAESYRGAIDQLMQYYGEGNVDCVKLEQHIDGPIELPESLLRELIENRENDF